MRLEPLPSGLSTGMPMHSRDHGTWHIFLATVVALGYVLLPAATHAQDPPQLPKQSAPTPPAVTPEEKAVRAVLAGQTAAWNKGDIDGFMAGYWKSEKLTFISGGSVTQGWEPTRERYVKRYAAGGKDTMGTLSFDELHFEAFGVDTAAVRGVFTLVRGGLTDSGRFTLLFRKLPDGWKIVHDHTSVGEKPAAKKGE